MAGAGFQEGAALSGGGLPLSRMTQLRGTLTTSNGCPVSMVRMYVLEGDLQLHLPPVSQEGWTQFVPPQPCC